MPEPFLIVCIHGLLCHNKGVELADMPKPLFSVSIRDLLCRVASPAIASDDVQNHRANRFEADDSDWRTAGRCCDCARVCGGSGGSSGSINVRRKGGRNSRHRGIAQGELGLI